MYRHDSIETRPRLHAPGASFWEGVEDGRTDPLKGTRVLEAKAEAIVSGSRFQIGGWDS